VPQRFKDLIGEVAVQPNEHFHIGANARYNVYNLGLRDANGVFTAIFNDYSASVGPRFNEQQGFRFLEAGATARLSRFAEAKTYSAWDVTAGRATEGRGGVVLPSPCSST